MTPPSQAASEYVEEVRVAARSMKVDRFEARFPWCFLALIGSDGADLTVQYATRSGKVDPDRPLDSARIHELLPMVKTQAAFSGPTSLLVGRSRACDLWINDASISKTHARFTLDRQKPVTLTDLGSRNGTRLAGEKLDAHEAVPVRIGDLINFGSVRTRLLDARVLQGLLA